MTMSDVLLGKLWVERELILDEKLQLVYS